MGTSTGKEFKEYFQHKKFVGFEHTGKTSDDAIDFQRSRLDLCVLNCASDQAKQDCKVMEGMLTVIQNEVEAL